MRIAWSGASPPGADERATIVGYDADGNPIGNPILPAGPRVTIATGDDPEGGPWELFLEPTNDGTGLGFGFTTGGGGGGCCLKPLEDDFRLDGWTGRPAERHHRLGVGQGHPRPVPGGERRRRTRAGCIPSPTSRSASHRLLSSSCPRMSRSRATSSRSTTAGTSSGGSSSPRTRVSLRVRPPRSTRCGRSFEARETRSVVGRTPTGTRGVHTRGAAQEAFPEIAGRVRRGEAGAARGEHPRTRARRRRRAHRLVGMDPDDRQHHAGLPGRRSRIARSTSTRTGAATSATGSRTRWTTPTAGEVGRSSGRA